MKLVVASPFLNLLCLCILFCHFAGCEEEQHKEAEDNNDFGNFGNDGFEDFDWAQLDEILANYKLNDDGKPSFDHPEMTYDENNGFNFDRDATVHDSGDQESSEDSTFHDFEGHDADI